MIMNNLSAMVDSNHRHLAPNASTLPTELTADILGMDTDCNGSSY